MSKKYPCPLCKGTGAVSAKIAKSKVELRDRAQYNERMKEINRAARLRKKQAETP